MLVSAYFSLKNEDRQYIFNPENVLYIDPNGVLFAREVYRMFADGEYEAVLHQIAEHIDKDWLDTVNL